MIVQQAPVESERTRRQAEEPLLDVRHLSVEYLTARGAVRAVDDVSFALCKGEVFGLAGESGCGKSTIAHAITRLLKPPAQIAGGQVLFRGQDIMAMDPQTLRHFRWSKISIVFQSAMNALNPVISVGAHIADTLQAHTALSKREALDRGADLLRIVGIESSRLKSYPHELSGGMRQRVVIALALALNPELIILDEPTTALDVVVQKEILQQIEDLKERFGFSILFITHDLSLLVEFSTRIAIMYAGRIVELAPAAALFEKPRHPYTVGLMNSFPSVTGPRREMRGIPGAPPDLAAPPGGCRFHPRCPHVMAVCRTADPVLTEECTGCKVACHLYPSSNERQARC
jgi:peptide/nickel transport system ATP-binding protein